LVLIYLSVTCYYQSNYSKVEAIPLSALPKDTTSELTVLSPHYPFFMLNVKQKSCEYQLLKSFGLTRPGNRIQVYRLSKTYPEKLENISVNLKMKTFFHVHNNPTV